MKIRFLQTTASAQPGFPFQAGQIIEVSQPTPEMLAWLEKPRDGTPRAEVIRDEERGEVAVQPTEPDVAVIARPRGRPRRVFE